MLMFFYKSLLIFKQTLVKGDMPYGCEESNYISRVPKICTVFIQDRKLIFLF